MEQIVIIFKNLMLSSGKEYSRVIGPEDEDAAAAAEWVVDWGATLPLPLLRAADASPFLRATALTDFAWAPCGAVALFWVDLKFVVLVVLELEVELDSEVAAAVSEGPVDRRERAAGAEVGILMDRLVEEDKAEGSLSSISAEAAAAASEAAAATDWE